MPDYKIVGYKAALNSVVDVKPGTIGGIFIHTGGPGADINAGLFYVCLEPVQDLELKPGEGAGEAIELPPPSPAK